MTYAQQTVYFGRSSQRIAAELIAYWSSSIAERISRHQVKLYAFTVSPTTAALVAFWAGVLAQSRTLQLHPEQAEALRLSLSSSRRAAFESLERISRPQVLCTKKSPQLEGIL